MAFAPRGSKGPGRSPKQSPYRTASATSHTPSSRAKTSLSFNTVQTKASDDACSVRSSCGSDNRNTFKSSSTSWYMIIPTPQLACSVTDSSNVKSACIYRKGDDVPTVGSQTPGNSYALHNAHGNCSGMHLIHEDTSYPQSDGLVTPAPKEGQRFGALPSLQLEVTSSQEPSGVNASVHTCTKTVHLSPAACKSLNQVAAQLWIMAYHQQYTPKQAESTADQGAEQLTQAALLHIIDTGVQLGLSSTQGRLTTATLHKKLIATCLAGLLLLILGLSCLHAISLQDNYAGMHYS